MLRAIGLTLALALASSGVYAEDDDDDKVPAAELEKVQATLTALGCDGYEEIKKEEQGIYEIDDAKCKMAPSISSWTGTTPSYLFRATDPIGSRRATMRIETGESADTGSPVACKHLLREKRDDPFAERRHSALGW